MKIDVEDLKTRLSMQLLLDYYNINDLHKSGNMLVGSCPVHNGDNENAFHVSLESNLWNCFTRKHGGDIFSFIMEYEEVGFKEALEIARQILNLSEESFPFVNPPKKTQLENKNDENHLRKEGNQALNFKLTLNPEHPYFKKRGIEKQSVDHFGLGICHKGILKGRIAIPIHDHEGNLVAYAGRSVNGEWPKYKFPIGFKKSQVLFNFHRAKEVNSENLIIVEGFFDCIRVHQAGFPNVVALMGSSISEFQKSLVLSIKRNLVILLDGDVVGRKATKQLLKAFREHVKVIPRYAPWGMQPDNMSQFDLKKILKTRG